MKGLLILMSLSVAACSTVVNTRHDPYNKSVETEVSHNYQLYAIDSTLRQLGYEYGNASHAISVNDAEKVYLQRFEEGLLTKRKAICKQELNEPACN